MLMRFERTKINNSRRKNSSIKRMQPINEEEMKVREKYYYFATITVMSDAGKCQQ